jgi:hypothetical protein
MSYLGMTCVKKKRAQRFQSSKDIRAPKKELMRLRDQRDTLLLLAKERPLSGEEGKELIRLANRVRKLERRLGYPDVQENCDAPNITS